jgi:hypothetical protein
VTHAPPPEPSRPGPPPRGLDGLRALWRPIAAALLLRYAAYAVMTALAIWNERRPAPTLPDAVLAHVPYVAWVANSNYVLWLCLYLPVAAGLLWERWFRWRGARPSP